MLEWLLTGEDLASGYNCNGHLCTSLHKCPYAQCPVINSFGSLVAFFTVKSRI